MRITHTSHYVYCIDNKEYRIRNISCISIYLQVSRCLYNGTIIREYITIKSQ